MRAATGIATPSTDRTVGVCPAGTCSGTEREYPDPQVFPNTWEGYGGGIAVGEATTNQVGSGPWPGQLGADAGHVGDGRRLRAAAVADTGSGIRRRGGRDPSEQGLRPGG